MQSTKPELIEVSQFASEQDAAGELQRKLQELIDAAAASETVSAIHRERRQAAARVESLKAAHQRLTRLSKEMAAAVRQAETRVDDFWIETPDAASAPAALGELRRIESEHRAVSRAALQVAERRLPLAEIVHLETEANEYFALARELSNMAQERIRRTAELMAQAAEHEGEIAFDSRKTLSGQLLAQAAEFQRRGEESQRWADERRQRHQRLMKEIDPAA
jgi:hypothetical protein